MWTQIQYSIQSFFLEKLNNFSVCLINFVKMPQIWRLVFHCADYSLCFSVSADLLWLLSVSLSTSLIKILDYMGPTISLALLSATNRTQAHWFPPFELGNPFNFQYVKQCFLPDFSFQLRMQSQDLPASSSVTVSTLASSIQTLISLEKASRMDKHCPW